MRYEPIFLLLDCCQDGNLYLLGMVSTSVTIGLSLFTMTKRTKRAVQKRLSTSGKRCLVLGRTDNLVYQRSTKGGEYSILGSNLHLDSDWPDCQSVMNTCHVDHSRSFPEGNSEHKATVKF